MITLCVLIGQVKSSEKRNNNNKTTAMASATNDIFKEKYLSPFDINTRGWQIFDGWKINEPQTRTYGKIIYTVEIGKRKRQHLLISGASLKNKQRGFANWLYTLDTNSWQNVDNGDFPPLDSSPVMIQLCSNIIALEFYKCNGYLFNSSNAWIFDPVLLNWRKSQIDGRDPLWLDVGRTHQCRVKVVPVAVRQSQTNCQCNQSALVLFHFKEFRSIMHELQCVSREGTERYKWIYINSNLPNPSFSEVKLASSYSGTIFIYFSARLTLWKFENETWTNIITVPYHLQLFYEYLQSNAFGCALVTERSTFLVFNIANKKVLNFDLKRNRYIIEDVVGDIPDGRYDVVSSTVEGQYNIVVFTLDLRSEKTRVWKFLYEHNVWIWKRLPIPDIVPSLGEVTTNDFKSNYLTFAAVFRNVIDHRLLSPFIWTLDLASMQWWKRYVSNVVTDEDERYFKYAVSSWIGSCLIGISSKSNKNVIKMWIYNATDNKLKLLHSNSSLRVRTAMSFVAVNKTTAILFGGTNSNYNSRYASNETWIMHLQPMLHWTQVTGDKVHSIRPSARFLHAAIIQQFEMYVFGGRDSSEGCLNDLWVFDVNTERWSKLTACNNGPNLSNASDCSYFAVSTPGQLIISVKYRHRSQIISYETSKQLETWLFIVHTKMWYSIAPFTVNDNSVALGTGVCLNSFYWKGFLVMFDIIHLNIQYLAVRCPAGLTSPNISNEPCNFCKKGYYRETIFSDTGCVPCPIGLTTVNIGARKISDCTVCKVNHCKYGKCVPNFDEGSLQPACQCYVGFTGSTCQYPTYWLIAAGSTLFVAVASAGVTAYLLLLNKKRKSESALQKEVAVLTNVWQIEEDEVMSEELLGSGASGYVHRAFYRNITVAVKKMVAVGLPKSIEDFETEIMFMRTVRHKNIVLFIGAGKSQPEDVPFLVMEYMERGSLRNVLYDLSIDIDYERKLSFAMDSARGMNFLHTLEPPRIHRDLKSDNLLVSKDWIVKVADFGLGRTVNGYVNRNDKQQSRSRNCSNPQYIPLLPKRVGLSYAGVGTARWRAPELTLREPYDTAVDVFRYYSLCTV